MSLLRFCTIILVIVALQGCDATYPKGKLADSIVEICNEEYSVEIRAKLIDNTLAVFIPLPSLLDVNFGINKNAQEMIQNVLLSASRVVLSTDANVEFYCIIAQDVRLPELQVIIMKYVDDVKRSFFHDISRGEYFKRTLFDININPQSKKEDTIKDIFHKYELDPEWQDQVLDEFFRSAPLALKDFGYWNDRFYVKAITLPEFIAEQIAYRVKLRFREDKELHKNFKVRMISGDYKGQGQEPFFEIDFDIATDEVLTAIGEERDREEIFRNVLSEAADCLYGYKFQDFNLLKLIDVTSQDKLTITKDELFALKRGRLKIVTLLGELQPY